MYMYVFTNHHFSLSPVQLCIGVVLQPTGSFVSPSSTYAYQGRKQMISEGGGVSLGPRIPGPARPRLGFVNPGLCQNLGFGIFFHCLITSAKAPV